jgi:hypothetical protein
MIRYFPGKNQIPGLPAQQYLQTSGSACEASGNGGVEATFFNETGRNASMMPARTAAMLVPPYRLVAPKASMT